MSAVFAHGDLRLFLLHLLAEQPRHGYELIQAIDEKFGGTYTPSPGTIYPRLAKLEEEGLVTSDRQGRTTTYALTTEGRAYLAANADRVEGMLGNVSASVRSLADEVREAVRESMKTLRADLAASRQQGRDKTENVETPPVGADAEGRFQAAAIERELAEVRRDVTRWLRKEQPTAERMSKVRDEIVAVRSRLSEVMSARD